MAESDKKTKLYRFLEMMPGMVAWSVIFFPVWGSFLVPRLVAYFIIAFLVFWFYQSFKNAFLGIIAFFKIKRTEKIVWHDLYEEEKKAGVKMLSWEKIKHIVIIPNVKESAEKISSNLDCLANQKEINKEQMVVVLAMEARVEGSAEKAQVLIKKYQNKFGKIFVTIHPHKLPGEIIGKASNEAWAAKQAKKILVDQLGWNINHLTVTSCDADACFNSAYFAALTYHFARDKKRYLRFWQSPIFWYNNLKRVPNLITIVGVIGHIIHIASLMEPEQLLFNYSAYSLSFKLLDSIGYWDVDIIPEDWHIFLQAFFAKKGKVLVKPIFVPTYIDAPEGKTYFEALKNRYLQCQRHAWGVTDIPYAFFEARRHPEVPLLLKVLRLYKLLESHLLWSTNWFILTLGALLPPLLNPKFFQTSFGYNLPKFSQFILTLCLISLAILIILDWYLRPKREKQLNFFQKVRYFLHWFLMPVSTLFLAVLPGLHAQTKLLFGKRLEYRVTKKY